MTLLILGLALCLILGSMLWVLPSKKERAQMQLRREAMRRGFQVQLNKLEERLNPFEKIHCVAYRLPRRKVKSQALSWIIYRATEEELKQLQEAPPWLYSPRSLRPTPEQQQAILLLLQALPQDVVAVDANPGRVSIYWHERGATSDLDSILRVLQELQEIA